MALDLKRLMLITRDVQFAIGLKRALEGLGEYSVTAVAAERNAIDELREEPPQLVLLDTVNLAVSPAIMIEMIRSRQSEVAIVLAPDNPDTQVLAHAYQLQAVVDIPASARSLLPIFESALRELVRDRPPAPPPGLEGDTTPIEALVDDFLEDESTASYTHRRLQASYELLNPPPESDAAPESIEVLIPPEAETDTIRYRYVQPEEMETPPGWRWGGADLGETPLAADEELETLRDLAQSLAEERPAADYDDYLTAPAPPDAEVDLENSAEFQQLLNTLLDESTTLEDLSLESLFDTTRELPSELGADVGPAWVRAAERFIREPEFLRAHLPPVDVPPSAGATTAPRPQAAETAAEAARAAETLPPPSSESETIPAADSLPAAETIPSAAAETETPPAAAPAPEPAPNNPPPAAGLPLSSQADDPFLAQLAVRMTQTMTDLAATATLLTRANRIVAFSGEMSLADLRALRGYIQDDWTAQRDHSRIRFIKLPAGADYMLYSRGTVAGFTLTMIFAGDKQLREIRRQADRMLNALANVPAAAPASPAADAPPAAADSPATAAAPAADSHQPFAFVWLLADATRRLPKNVAQQLVFWLEVQLNKLNWKIHRLDVHQDFISLYADVPGETTPETLIHTVMENSRQIACAEDVTLPKKLWADAYLVLQPGREMSERELQRFLQFARG